MTLAEADAELQRLTLLKKNHLDEQYLARHNVRKLPDTIASLSDRLSRLTEDQTTATHHAADPITIGGRTRLRDEAPAVLAGQLDTAIREVREKTRIPLSVYRGLGFGLILNPNFLPDVYLEGAISRRSVLSREHQGPRAVLNALERLAIGYGTECDRVRQDLTISESQLRDYQARLGALFPHEAYLAELTDLRDQLKAGLAGKMPDSNGDPQPSVSELAEKIKVLKAAHSIEAAPQRIRQKQVSAEEPVTTRIRRRSKAASVSDPTIQTDVPAPGAEPSPPAKSTWRTIAENLASVGIESNLASPPRPGTPKSQMTFQQRLAMERQQRDPEPSLP